MKFNVFYIEEPHGLPTGDRQKLFRRRLASMCAKPAPRGDEFLGGGAGRNEVEFLLDNTTVGCQITGVISWYRYVMVSTESGADRCLWCVPYYADFGG